MGGSGTSNNQDSKEKSRAETKGFTKTCYYELLGVEKDATPQEINKGYKKMSLKWHPDKNQGVDTTEQFQDINEAYQCLSDPQSRTWYDNNRDSILRGKKPEEMNEADEVYFTKIKLKPYLSSKCYPGGFDHTKKDNFYAIYGNLFRQLDKEEEEYEEVGKKHYEAPDFGKADASSEEVFAFYSFWEDFSSQKPFAYADLYDVRTAPNRRVKRIIEVENNKERKRERQEFSDLVRELIEQLKDKDPRYKKYLLIQQQEKEEKRRKIEEEKQAKRDFEAERLKKYREERAAAYQKEEEEALARGDVEEVFIEEFRCDLCKKTFKSEQKMSEHLQSKKHKEIAGKFKQKVSLDEETEKILEQKENDRQQKEQIEQKSQDMGQIGKEDKDQKNQKKNQKKNRKRDSSQSSSEEEEKKQQVETGNTEVKVEDDEYEKWKQEKKAAKNKKEKKGQSNKGQEKIEKEFLNKINEQRKKDQLKKVEKDNKKKQKFEEKKQKIGIKIEDDDNQKSDDGKSEKSDNDQNKDQIKVSENQKEEKNEEEVKVEDVENGEQKKDDDNKKDDESESDSSDSEDALTALQKKKQEAAKKKQKALQKAQQQLAGHVEPVQIEDDKLTKKFNKLKEKNIPEPVQEEDKNAKNPKKQNKNKKDNRSDSSDKEQDKKGDQKEEISKKEKRKQKQKDKTQNSDLKCNVCKEEFESKSKLFKHINATGHALKV